LVREESAANAINPLISIRPIVDRLRNGILFPILSDRAQKIGEVISTKIVASEKLAPYRISGILLSKITH